MKTSSFGSSCPIPQFSDGECVGLAHGDGGGLTRQLLEQRIAPLLERGRDGLAGDAAVLEPPGGRLAFTADSFVVTPLFFPGGDIGRLAVFGTVNDLVVAGASPLWMSLSLILEEGLPLRVLDRVLASVGTALQECDVRLVTGDTKVVPRGAADGLFLCTSGVGQLVGSPPPGPQALQPGDVLVVSGPIGRHGLAILAARHELGFDPPPESDCASLRDSACGLLSDRVPIRAMRDATRGGVAAVCHEWSRASGTSLRLMTDHLPVTSEVAGACELLGLEPWHLANEGTMLVAVPASEVDRALASLRRHASSREAAVVGEVLDWQGTAVVRTGLLGEDRPVDEPATAPLPRIC
ncbi:MAG: hydrogenase expression/formation protein HypE [Planctomycetaceae bacterium]